MPNRVVIFDRDGTLIRPTIQLSEVELLPGVREGVRLLREAGYLLAMATNQPGPAKGQCTHYDVAAINQEVAYQLGEPFAHVEVCHHRAKDYCGCRKPASGMLHYIALRLTANVRDCWMVGDSENDMCAAQNARMRGVLIVPSSWGKRGVEWAAKEIIAADAEKEKAR